MGHILDQKGMVTFDESNTTSGSQAGFVKVVLPDGMPESRINEIRLEIARSVPQAEGDTLRDGSLVFGNFSEYGPKELHIDDKQFHEAIRKVVDAMPETMNVKEPERFHSEYMQAHWGDNYIPDGSRGYLEGTRYGSNSEQAGQGQRGDDLRGRGGSDSSWIEGVRDYSRRVSDKAVSYYSDNPTRPERSGATDSGRTPSVSYGTPREGSASAIGVHFSQQPRKLLSSEFYGQGHKGEERFRLSNPSNADISPRIYFYVDNGSGIHPEQGVGGARHEVQLNNLYPAKEDPLGIIKNAKRGDGTDRLTPQSGAMSP